MVAAGKGKQKKEYVHKKQKVLSRKQRRKQERAAKKQRKKLFSTRKSVSTTTGHETVPPPPSTSNSKKTAASLKGKQSATRSRNTAALAGSSSSPPQKKTRLHRANEEDKKEIEKLERLLKMGKNKKTKKLPNSFREDGLDYLLELTEKGSEGWELSEEEGEDREQLHGNSSIGGDDDSGPEEMPLASSAVKQSQLVSSGVKQSQLVSSGVKQCQLETALSSSAVQSEASVVSGGILKKRTKMSKPSSEKRKRVSFSASCKDVTEDSDDCVAVGEGAELEEEEYPQELGEDYFDTESIESDSEDSNEGEEDSDEEDDENEEEDDNEEEEEGEEDSNEEDDDEEEEEEDNSEEDDGDEEDGNEGEVEGAGDSDGYRESGNDTDDNDGDGESLSYVLPHCQDSGRIERLKRRVQGLFNRLAESNMKGISGQLEQLYHENSRNDMNEAVWEVLEKACVSPVLVADKFAMEQTMAIALLHNHVGTEVGAYVVQKLAVGLNDVLWSGEEEKRSLTGSEKQAECLILLLSHLYNYRVIHCVLIYDIIRKLVETFTERDIELLLLLLKNTGMEIRRDDSRSLKDIIVRIKCKAADSAVSQTSRVKFMLETISALKTNNSRKIPNHDPSLLEHMKKLLRGLLRSKGSLDESQLKISLHDLLNADKQGRWWVVGSAWAGVEKSSQGTGVGVGVASEPWVLELARKQRMNTDIRKTIFGVLMTSEDYLECFQKLVHLGLKEVQEREVVHVLVDCCLQEKQYNPYYAYLGQKLCEFKRSHQVTFQYTLWDRFKGLESLTATNLTNLCSLCSHLLLKKALSLSILKVVEFTGLSKCELQFYKSLLVSVLTEAASEGVVEEVFSRIAPLPHLKRLRDSLLVFIQHYLVAPVASGRDVKMKGEELARRTRRAEQVLRTEHF